MTHPANVNNKPEAHIERWYLVKGLEGTLGYLTGSVSGHERQDEFRQVYQQTTMMKVFKPENGYMETQNTFYTLGAPYTDQMQHADQEQLRKAIQQEVDEYKKRTGADPASILDLLDKVDP